ncbi:hypothetical protein [Thermoplasma volcanium GSS1]|uniref:Transcription regulator PadR N-terminal domain-containing protein n=1 Tax=Thermoplasma volcanium (strain ATCC 51530 / DSM 4299 / JCM 9571 / NBRC 15438 / GSS1) TaxID=273116 RepID=Q97A48_THEVO|nr:PadR family transcriptional regulator [Thermoplasma volcanium]BAB60104.1 hypothetical protein [Thermoplasma volcanium GSS1]
MFDKFNFVKRRGNLKYWILYLVSTKPMNGAEVMDEIERHSFGMWRPSPGSVYPALEQLEADGLVIRNEDGRYAATEQGKEELGITSAEFSRSPKTVSGIVDEIESMVMYLSDVMPVQPEDSKLNVTRLENVVSKINELISKWSGENADNKN